MNLNHHFLRGTQLHPARGEYLKTLNLLHPFCCHWPDQFGDLLEVVEDKKGGLFRKNIGEVVERVGVPKACVEGLGESLGDAQFIAGFCEVAEDRSGVELSKLVSEL